MGETEGLVLSALDLALGSRGRGPAVLAWMVNGLHDFLGDRSWVAPEVAEATAAYRQAEDRFSGFLAERCDLGHGYWTATADLRDAYEAWCRDKDEEPAGQRAFLNALSETGCAPKAAAQNKKGWRGIRIKRAFKGPETPRVTHGDGTSGSSNELGSAGPIMDGPSPCVTPDPEPEADLDVF